MAVCLPAHFLSWRSPCSEIFQACASLNLAWCGWTCIFCARDWKPEGRETSRRKEKLLCLLLVFVFIYLWARNVIFFILCTFSCTTGLKNTSFITIIMMMIAQAINYSLSEEEMFLLSNCFKWFSSFCCLCLFKPVFAMAMRWRRGGSGKYLTGLGIVLPQKNGGTKYQRSRINYEIYRVDNLKRAHKTGCWRHSCFHEWTLCKLN